MVKNKIKLIDEKFFFKIIKFLYFIIKKIYSVFNVFLLVKRIYFNEKINSLFFGNYQLKKGKAKEIKLLLKKQILKSSEKDTFKFLEIGSYLGNSTEFFGKILEESKRNFLIISIDPYKFYSSLQDTKKESTIKKMSEQINKIYFAFLYNIGLQNWRDNFLHIRKDSKKGLLLLQELKLFFDFIYIDGSHYYKDIKNDFILSKKIIKKRANYQGIICGDDYEFEIANHKQINFSKIKFIQFLEKNKNSDYVVLKNNNGKNIGFHPGITKFFSEIKDTIERKNSGFWILKN